MWTHLLCPAILKLRHCYYFHLRKGTLGNRQSNIHQVTPILSGRFKLRNQWVLSFVFLSFLDKLNLKPPGGTTWQTPAPGRRFFVPWPGLGWQGAEPKRDVYVFPEKAAWSVVLDPQKARKATQDRGQESVPKLTSNSVLHAWTCCGNDCTEEAREHHSEWG
jgi:hypothetical protein